MLLFPSFRVMSIHYILGLPTPEGAEISGILPAKPWETGTNNSNATWLAAD